MSRKKYIYTIDDDCFVAKTPSGEDINALEQHIKNLLTPSTPFFFNTLYDPYTPGSDFVRGYPFSMREGAPTAVSHGNQPSIVTATLTADCSLLLEPNLSEGHYMHLVLSMLSALPKNIC